MIIHIDDLKNIIKDSFISKGLSEDQAEIVADYFVETEACGVTTHGLALLPAHINKIKAGGHNLDPKISIIREGGAFAVFDADNAIGMVSAVRCISYAIEKSREAGIFTVFSRNCNTYGAAFYYPLLAAREGLIGITFCNTPPAMSPWGGKEKMLGTNPFAIAIPCGEKNPVIFDMATSKVAKSRLSQALKNEEEIPLGWALDEKGEPTTNPIEAIKGTMLPMGGHKGYGLSLIIDILAGVLSGAAFLQNVGKFYNEEDKCMNVGQTFIAIDPKKVYGEDFYEIMDDYILKIKSSKSIENYEIRIPGENKMQFREEALLKGLKIKADFIESLK